MDKQKLLCAFFEFAHLQYRNFYKGDFTMKDYTEYIIQQAQKLLSIDSPSGYTEHVSQWLLENAQRNGI